jgi:hypothetical protein
MLDWLWPAGRSNRWPVAALQRHDVPGARNILAVNLSGTGQTYVSWRSNVATMGQAERPKCPGCGAYLILALPPGGKGKRTFQCFECDGPDPLKTDKVTGWLKSGELQPPE